MFEILSMSRLPKRSGRILERLKEICELETLDVFYPLEDVVLALCVQNPGYWSPYINALLPGAKALDNCYDKWKTIQIAINVEFQRP